MAIKYVDIPDFVKKYPSCLYYLIFGERSNGKTYGVKEIILDEYLKNGGQGAIIRRYDEDWKGKESGSVLWDDMIAHPTLGNVIEKKTKGRWNFVKWDARHWNLAHRNEKGEIDDIDPKPLAYAFALTKEDSYKGKAFPEINTIFFDEFMTRKYYLQEEFLLFTSICSTIIRLRTNVKIFMCANTITTYCPYFVEMGLKHAKHLQDGEIEVYNIGETNGKIAVWHTEAMTKVGSKPSNIYFAFDNPKLKMITGGAWELKVYPRMPFEYKPKEIILLYFIIFDNEIFQCEIIKHEKMLITFIHRKTTPIKEDNKALVYQQDFDPRPNYSRKIGKPTNNLQKFIARFFVKEKVFYQDNAVGDSIEHYLKWQATA